jgi:hypothetical protein
MNVAEKNIFDSYLLLKACPGCGAIVGSYINDLFLALLILKCYLLERLKYLFIKVVTFFVKKQQLESQEPIAA